MKKLSEQQLEVLVAKRNAAGEKAIVAVMTNEELAAYRINCVEAIERGEGRISKAKNGSFMQQTVIENVETLRSYVAYIDAKLAEEKNEAAGEAAIDQFLATYKEKAVNYFINLCKNYREKRYSHAEEITAEGLRLIPASAWGGRKYTEEKIEEMINSLDSMIERRKDMLKRDIGYYSFQNWKSIYPKSHIKTVENISHIKDEDTLKIAIETIVGKDVEVKKENIYKLVEAKAGKIIDAKFLRVGLDGELNGFIIGDKNKVNVTSFGAGGWNIQKYHYRLKVTVA
ncbi:hypothetical protein P4661_27585 [Priestia megaterium]|uniref:hypothetical protein n=1 Tax=Priestia megaterium TaxID=1404 RepID=UPI002E2417E6|nr:hypothetical protein [Priestia megaterium]